MEIGSNSTIVVCPFSYISLYLSTYLLSYIYPHPSIHLSNYLPFYIYPSVICISIYRSYLDVCITQLGHEILPLSRTEEVSETDPVTAWQLCIQSSLPEETLKHGGILLQPLSYCPPAWYSRGGYLVG